MIWYDIYLTATGLTTRGNSTVHIYTKNNKQKNKMIKEYTEQNVQRNNNA